jgi:HSP90 family molecular chaperone
VPSLDELPKLEDSDSSRAIRAKARELARQLRVRLIFDKVKREFTVAIEDDGIGQPPALIHRTLLSLGSTTKADKWYLIGVFGQGGSSAYAVSKFLGALSSRPRSLGR